MIPRTATLSNTVLLVVDVINACAHVKYEKPDWNIHYRKIRQMVPSLGARAIWPRRCRCWWPISLRRGG